MMKQAKKRVAVLTRVLVFALLFLTVLGLQTLSASAAAGDPVLYLNGITRPDKPQLVYGEGCTLEYYAGTRFLGTGNIVFKAVQTINGVATGYEVELGEPVAPEAVTDPEVAQALGNQKATLVLDELRLPAGKYTVKATCDIYPANCEALVYLTVLPRQVTVNGLAVVDKIYDGTNVGELDLSGVFFENALPDEPLAIDPTCGSVLFADQVSVGSGLAVSVHGLALAASEGVDPANYELIASDSLTGNILPRPLQLQGVSLKEPRPTYNGQTALELLIDTLTLEGLLDTDLDLVAIEGELAAVAASPNAGVQRVLLSGLTLTGDAASNYTLAYPDLTVEILPRTITVRVDKVTLYKGEPLPTAFAMSFSGFIAGESESTVAGFLAPTVTPVGKVDTLTCPTAFAVTFAGGSTGGNYVFDYVEEVELEVKRLFATADDYAVSVYDLTRWQGTPILLSPKGQYVSVSVGDAAYMSMQILSEQGERTVTFTLKTASGAVCEPITLTYCLDTTAPTGDVLKDGQSLLAEASDYRYFFFGETLLSMTGSDALSGVAKLEYRLEGDAGYTPIADGQLRLPVGARGVLYLRITDVAGNQAVVQTAGLVCFGQTAFVGDPLCFERLSAGALDILLALNGNVVSGVLLDGVALPTDAFTLAADGTLSISADALQDLPAGQYTLTLTLLPAGIEVPQDFVGTLPADVVIELQVILRAPTAQDLILTPPADPTYNGASLSAQLTLPQGVGELISLVYIDAQGNRLDAMLHAGRYTVEITLGEGTHYAACTALILGEIEIAPYKLPEPAVSFNAADRTLSGDVAGLLYSLNGTDFAPLPANFVGLITGPCTLTLYLPGDGVDTLDSDPVELMLVRADAPIGVAFAETLFGICDGKILLQSAGVEYRFVGEQTWRVASGEEITSLAPGSYELRTAANGAVLESDIVVVSVAAAPEFLQLNCNVAIDQATGKLPGFAVQGWLTANPTLVLSELSLDDPANEAFKKAFDARLCDVLYFFTPVLSGRHDGALTVTISLDAAYEGKTLSLYRMGANGEIEMQEYLCENQTVTLTVDDLSGILITTAMTTPRGIGTMAWIYLLLGMGIGMLVIFVVIEVQVRTTRKKQKANG